jgi:hypothetical protein
MSETSGLESVETSGTAGDAGNNQALEVGESGPAGIEPLNSGDQALEHVGETAQTLEHDGQEALETVGATATGLETGGTETLETAGETIGEAAHAIEQDSQEALETVGEAAGQAEADVNMVLEDVGSFADHVETEASDTLQAAGHIASVLDGGGDRLLSEGVQEVGKLATEVGESGPAAPTEQALGQPEAGESSGESSSETGTGTSGDGLTSLLAETGELGPAEVAVVEMQSTSDGGSQSDAMATAMAQADAVAASSRSFFTWAEASGERATENLPQSDQSRGRGR